MSESALNKSMEQKKRSTQLSRQVTLKGLPELKDAESLITSFNRHLFFSLLRDRTNATKLDLYKALALTLRDQMANKWIKTQRVNRDQDAKHIHYFSLEFYLGRLMSSVIHNLGVETLVENTLDEIEVDLESIVELEHDAGLGNGGLGRLAACFLESMATLNIPFYGYGLRYEYGIFEQTISENGDQVERADQWLENGFMWEISRNEDVVPIHFYGNIENGKWINTQVIYAVPHDVPIPGFRNGFIGTLRLWSAKASNELSFDKFNTGDYVSAVYEKNLTENITRVLYPSDNTSSGKELRLKQEYLLVAASIRDIMNRFFETQNYLKNKNRLDKSESTTGFTFENQANIRELFRHFHEKNVIQLNDTHPALAIPELMRVLIDDYQFSWEDAWNVVSETFNYTNHTVLPEALEKWPVHLLERVLPRHLQIIFQINHHHLASLRVRMVDFEMSMLQKMSIIEESPVKSIRMAYMCIVGSNKVNGVARVHSNLIKKTIFSDFNRYYGENPAKFINVTNGVTPRRWILQCNQGLSNLLISNIGTKWIEDLKQLKKLNSYATNTSFLKKFSQIKHDNKIRLAEFLSKRHQIELNPDWLLSVQVKRIHEYKRQLLNLLHVVYLYVQIKNGASIQPRAFIIGGKAAPGYFRAKNIIKLINKVSKTIDTDHSSRNMLKLIFLPNYDVSTAEIVIPAADISEQISLAGMEASGTGNMKFMMNGALTVGTLDGANQEIYEAVGKENMFAFGLQISEVDKARESYHHERQNIINSDPVLFKALNMIQSGFFHPEDPNCFRDIIDDLYNHDYYMLMKDFHGYVAEEKKASELYYKDDSKTEWFQKALKNVAESGIFSSDESIRNYAKNVWHIDHERKSLE